MSKFKVGDVLRAVTVFGSRNGMKATVSRVHTEGCEPGVFVKWEGSTAEDGWYYDRRFELAPPATKDFRINGLANEFATAEEAETFIKGLSYYDTTYTITRVVKRLKATRVSSVAIEEF